MKRFGATGKQTWPKHGIVDRAMRRASLSRGESRAAMLMHTVILCSAAPALNELEEVLTAASAEDMLGLHPSRWRPWPARDVHAAFRRRALACHPDRHCSGDPARAIHRSFKRSVI